MKKFFGLRKSNTPPPVEELEAVREIAAEEAASEADITAGEQAYSASFWNLTWIAPRETRGSVVEMGVSIKGATIVAPLLRHGEAMSPEYRSNAARRLRFSAVPDRAAVLTIADEVDAILGVDPGLADAPLVFQDAVRRANWEAAAKKAPLGAHGTGGFEATSFLRVVSPQNGIVERGA